MTKIDFAINAPDKLLYVCRVVRKKYAEGVPLVIYWSDTAKLEELNRALWTFSPLDFVPHCYAHEADAAQSPVVLTAQADTESHFAHHELLLNLDANWPPFFARFSHLIELVTQDEADKAAGRARYKFYKDRGYALTHHDLAGG